MIHKDHTRAVFHDPGADIVHGHPGAIIVDHAGVSLDEGKSVVQALPLLLGQLAVTQPGGVYAGQLGHGAQHQLAPVLLHGQVIHLTAVTQAQSQSESQICLAVSGTSGNNSDHLFTEQTQLIQFTPCHPDAGVRLLQPLERLVPDLGKILDVRVHRFPPQVILFFQRLAQIPADGVRVRRVHGDLGSKLQQQALAVVLHHQRLIVLHMADGWHGLCCQHDQRPEVSAQHPLQYHGIHVMAGIQLQLDGCEQLPVWPILEHGRSQTLHGILARRRV